MGLVDGFNHVAVLTKDLDRLSRFYRDMFEVETVWSGVSPLREGTRHALFELSPASAIHAFEFPEPHVDGFVGGLFERGRVDHIALSVPDEAVLARVRDRLVEGGYCDGTITRFGSVVSLYFEDPDGLPCEVCYLEQGSRGFADLSAPSAESTFWQRNESQ